MKNLIIFAMIMMVLGSGYMFGTKLAPDTGLSKIPALDNNEMNYSGDQSGNGIYSGTEDGYDVLNSLFENFGSLGYLFNDSNYDTADMQTSEDELSDQTGFISREEAKNIAQQYIEEPGAVAGEPVLADGIYIVPVLFKGKTVGEIHIDARTGKNLGGAGGVDDNETVKPKDNNTKQICNESYRNCTICNLKHYSGYHYRILIK